jgi:hypothetical protein
MSLYIFYSFRMSSMFATCPARLSLFGLITVILGFLYIHSCVKWESNPLSQCSNSQDALFTACGHCAGLVNVIPVACSRNYIPTKADGYEAANGTIHVTERVAMRQHCSIYQPQTSAPSQARQTLAFVGIYWLGGGGWSFYIKGGILFLYASYFGRPRKFLLGRGVKPLACCLVGI